MNPEIYIYMLGHGYINARLFSYQMISNESFMNEYKGFCLLCDDTASKLVVVAAYHYMLANIWSQQLFNRGRL